MLTNLLKDGLAYRQPGIAFYRCFDDKHLRVFCLDSLPTKGNDLSWWYTCPQAILPIAPNCVYLASGLWCLVSVIIIWLGLLFRATSLHNDLINKANGTSVLTMVAQWLKRVKIIFHFAFCSSCSCSTLRLVPGKFVLITSFAWLVSCNSRTLEKQPFKNKFFFRYFCKCGRVETNFCTTKTFPKRHHWSPFRPFLGKIDF